MTRNQGERTALDRVLALAAKQHGAFTARQATGLGMSYHQLARMVDNGLARRRRRGSYVVAGSPDTPERRTIEAVLAAPPGAVASHESAAHLLGMVPEPPSQVHITVGIEERLRLDGVVAHRSPLPRSHVATVGHIPVTSLARTAVDLASVSDLDRLAQVIDPLLVSKRLRPGRLLRVVDEIVDAPGRHGTALLRSALEVWTEPIRPGSAAEVRLLRKAREFGFRDYVTQHEVGSGDDRFFLDVSWPQERVLLEYSGKAFHGPRRWKRDEDRVAKIEALGWAHREVDANDLVPGATSLWNWLGRQLRGRRAA